MYLLVPGARNPTLSNSDKRKLLREQKGIYKIRGRTEEPNAGRRRVQLDKRATEARDSKANCFCLSHVYQRKIFSPPLSPPSPEKKKSFTSFFPH
jgi:hypothetical protein